MEHGVLINVFTISYAFSKVIFSPKATMLESLSVLVAIASSLESTFAQRIPFTLLQAILIPIPDPQMATPKSTSFSMTPCPKRKA